MSTISTTLAQLIANVDPIQNETYKLTDGGAMENPNQYPIYIECKPDMLFDHNQAHIKLPSAFDYSTIHYSRLFDSILYFKDDLRCIQARDLNYGAGGLVAGGNCVAVAIAMTEYAYLGGSPQWQLNNWTNATVNYPTPITDLEYLAIELEDSSMLTLATSLIATCYYAKVGRGSHLFLEDYAIAIWTQIKQDSFVKFGMNNMGMNNGLGVGVYWISAGNKVFFESMADCIFNEYITLEDAANVSIGQMCQFNAPLVCRADSSVVIEDGCTFDYMLEVDSHAVVRVPMGSTWGEAHITLNGSTLKMTVDVGTDPTPDFTDFQCAGFITVECTGTSPFTITEIQNLRPDCEYTFIIAPTRNIIFDDSSLFFVFNGAVDFSGNGSKGDSITMRTNSTATQLIELYRNNY